MAEFPAYRRLPNHRNYYRIEAPDRMLEIRVMGRYYAETLIEARILPERLLIADLLGGGIAEVIDESAFFSFQSACRSTLERRDL